MPSDMNAQLDGLADDLVAFRGKLTDLADTFRVLATEACRRPVLVRIVASPVSQGREAPGRSAPYTVQRVALKGTDKDGMLDTEDVDGSFPAINIGRISEGSELTLCYPVDGGGWVIDLE